MIVTDDSNSNDCSDCNGVSDKSSGDGVVDKNNDYCGVRHIIIYRVSYST